MTTASPTAAAATLGAPHRNWFCRTEDWLDDRGKGAWIALMVLAFIFVWPVGLAILAYMIWSKRMFSRNGGCAARRHAHHMGYPRAWASSGNSAFDAYKAETLKRLEDEQAAFESFLQRLREAKDKQEFDAFMDDRAKAPRPAAPETEVARSGEY